MHPKTSLAAAALAFSSSFFLSGPVSAQTSNDCNAQDQQVMNTWFAGPQVPWPGPTLSSSSLCAFHVWSTQAFLFLTQTDPNTGNMFLEEQLTADELFAPEVPPVAARAKRTLQLRPRVTKNMSPQLEEINQAGSRGVLVDHNGRILYYEQLFNEPFREFVTENFFNPSTMQFDPAMLEAATDPDAFFPSEIMEIKSSWMIVPDGTTGYLTTQAEVFLLDQDTSGNITVDPTATQSVTVALVGLHIAATVEDHPEMIWATFEHMGNAPVLPAGMTPSSTSAVSAQDFTFYTAGTPANASNQNALGKLTLDKASQTLSPITQVYRQFGHGTPVAAKDGDVNVADIDFVNSFVQQNMPGSTPVKSYFEVGAVWMTPNSLEPDQFPITQLRGSTMLSNSTMETYTQADAQCFSCHNTLPVTFTSGSNKYTLPGTNFNISHALVGEWMRTVATQAGHTVAPLR